MCGILGGCDVPALGRGQVKEALEKLRHRGPDDCGALFADSAVLGMRRLAIIDLLGGQQPLFNEDRSVAVVFNGEIYNFRELALTLQARGHIFRTNSDTEVLVHLYEERGPEMCSLLGGMFAFGIYDLRERRLMLGRDRLGKKPLFYTRVASGGIIFASELKALKVLAAGAGENWSIRPEGIYDYLSLDCVPQPETIFREVSAVPRGSSLCYQSGQLTQRQYWSLHESYSLREEPTEDVFERTRALIAGSVTQRLCTDVPLGVFLSGGVDSSIIAYEAARATGSDLHTFTVSVKDAAYDESRVARETAQFLKVKNTVLPLELEPGSIVPFLAQHYDQPFADSSAIPSYAISRLAAQHVKVVLIGDGGDELFGGYRRHVAARFIDRFSFLKAFACPLGRVGEFVAKRSDRRSTLGFLARFARGLSMEPPRRYLAWTTDTLEDGEKRKFWRGAPTRSTESQIGEALPDMGSELRRQMFGDVVLLLSDLLLVKMDMASMAASIEARSPFLDDSLIRFSASLPDDHLIVGCRTKALLRDAYRGRLPENVLRAPKRGFEIPLVSWLEKELKPLILDCVKAKDARITAYLDSSFVNGLFDRRALSEKNRARLLYNLLILELWLRQQRAPERI